jgi:hypothetical protein
MRNAILLNVKLMNAIIRLYDVSNSNECHDSD